MKPKNDPLDTLWVIGQLADRPSDRPTESTAATYIIRLQNLSHKCSAGDFDIFPITAREQRHDIGQIKCFSLFA